MNSGPKFNFFSPTFKPLYDAVSEVWSVFEIRRYDAVINFNDLKLLELGEKIYSKEQLFTLFCADTKLIMILRDIFMLMILIPYIYSV